MYLPANAFSGKSDYQHCGELMINSIKIILKDDSKNISDGLWLRKSVSIWRGGGGVRQRDHFH